jgi:hypothetical protein
MKFKRIGTIMVPLCLVTLITTSIGLAASPTQPSNFADPAFKSTWTRTDEQVSSGQVKRSYYWGPSPGDGRTIRSLYEQYDEGPNGMRLVQYFDKSRMEINNPNGDKSSPFYVTNGLLAVEMITGQIQVGNKHFIPYYPADINLASDVDDISLTTPTYASFRSVYYMPPPGNRVGQLATETINRLGQVGTGTWAAKYGVKYAYQEPATKHNIPDVFWSFLNLKGPVIDNGKQVDARLSDPYYYASGYPVTEAYWATVRIAGVADTPVLIQVFERRVLTYVPSLPEGFKVQMGNIGQHYYDWRYPADWRTANPVPPPLPTQFPTPTPVYRSTRVPCENVPPKGFGKVWTEYPTLQDLLGSCGGPPYYEEVVQQSFQHGQMLELIDKSSIGTYKALYVLFEDGTMQLFEDKYQAGDPEPSGVVAPPGNYVPVRGLGKLWHEGTSPNIRERLGWATAPEISISQGAVVGFWRGAMVSMSPTLKKIYLLSRGSHDAIDKGHWVMFDDTYVP